MSSPEVLPVLVLGGVKHLYIVQALAAHPRFELVALADEEEAPDWVHERNQTAASAFGLPYVRGVSAALDRYRPPRRLRHPGDRPPCAAERDPPPRPACTSSRTSRWR